MTSDKARDILLKAKKRQVIEEIPVSQKIIWIKSADAMAARVSYQFVSNSFRGIVGAARRSSTNPSGGNKYPGYVSDGSGLVGGEVQVGSGCTRSVMVGADCPENVPLYERSMSIAFPGCGVEGAAVNSNGRRGRGRLPISKACPDGELGTMNVSNICILAKHVILV